MTNKVVKLKEVTQAKEESIKLTGINEVLNSLQINVKAKKGQYNKFGRYKYRTAEDILLAVKEELKKEHYPKDCVVITNVELKEILNRLFVCVTSTLRVGSDEISSQGLAEHGKDKKGMDEAQLTGSTITYARKYALQNLFGIDESEEDIDSKDNSQNKQPANQFQRIANAAEGDMENTQRKAAEEYFATTKNSIEKCDSIEAIEIIIDGEAKAFNKLRKYHADLHDKLEDCKQGMIEILTT